MGTIQIKESKVKCTSKQMQKKCEFVLLPSCCGPKTVHQRNFHQAKPPGVSCDLCSNGRCRGRLEQFGTVGAALHIHEGKLANLCSQHLVLTSSAVQIKNKLKPYDWYGSFSQLKQFITPNLRYFCKYTRDFVFMHCSASDKILVLGCGNSSLGQELYNAGYPHIVNVDYSATVIEMMRTNFPLIEWKVMNVTNMEDFEDCR